MLRSCKSWCHATSLLALLLAAPALAQQATTAEQATEPEPDESAAQDIVVTGSRERFRPDIASSGTKLPISISETPQAISVISSDLIKVAGLKSVADL